MVASDARKRVCFRASIVWAQALPAASLRAASSDE